MAQNTFASPKSQENLKKILRLVFKERFTSSGYTGSNKTIAAKLGLSEVRVKQLVGFLLRSGWLESERICYTWGGDAKFWVNKRALRIPKKKHITDVNFILESKISCEASASEGPGTQQNGLRDDEDDFGDRWSHAWPGWESGPN